jgi:hypothetical protein
MVAIQLRNGRPGVIPTTRSAKPRRGCLSNVLLILVLGIAFVLVFTALAYPWAYFLGGHFHILPIWRGWGRVHSPAGDYLLFTQVFARTGGRRVSRLRGSAVLCTPRGQTYSLTIYGDFRKRPGLTTNVDGLPLYLSISQNLNFLQTNQDTRLRFELEGAWQGPDLVTDDRGTLPAPSTPTPHCTRATPTNARLPACRSRSPSTKAPARTSMPPAPPSTRISGRNDNNSVSSGYSCSGGYQPYINL